MSAPNQTLKELSRLRVYFLAHKIEVQLNPKNPPSRKIAGPFHRQLGAINLIGFLPSNTN